MKASETISLLRPWALCDLRLCGTIAELLRQCCFVYCLASAKHEHLCHTGRRIYWMLQKREEVDLPTVGYRLSTSILRPILILSKLAPNNPSEMKMYDFTQASWIPKLRTNAVPGPSSPLHGDANARESQADSRSDIDVMAPAISPVGSFADSSSSSSSSNSGGYTTIDLQNQLMITTGCRTGTGVGIVRSMSCGAAGLAPIWGPGRPKVIHSRNSSIFYEIYPPVAVRSSDKDIRLYLGY